MRYKNLGLAAALFMLVFSTIIQQAWAADSNAVNARQQLATSVLADIKQATWISEGKSEHILYIFFDPNCPYCHRLYVNTRSWLKQGKLQLRWIPVGILTTTSAGKAIAILQAEDPLAAFTKNESNYDSGGAIEEDLADPATEKKLKANEELLARISSQAVPIMLFMEKSGKANLVIGSPPKSRLDPILEKIK